MRKSSKLILIAGAVAAIGGPAALASSAFADTVSTAPDCLPVKAAPAWTEIQYKYTPVKNGAGPTHWAKSAPTSKTQTIDINGVSYANANSVRKIEHPAVEAVTCAVAMPQFGIQDGGDGPYVIVPDIPHVKTYLYGVQGHPEDQAISGDVKVTPDMVGGQFWIGYKYEDGYAPANPAVWHVDFATGAVEYK